MEKLLKHLYFTYSQHLFCAFFSLMIAACGYDKYQYKLVAVDSLATTHPDSARNVLLAMSADTATMNKKQRMYYKLLTLKADIKSYIPQTSDAKAMEVLDYYEHDGDRKLLPYAYYYTATTYKDMNDAPRAIKYFQKVIDAMHKSGDLQLESYTYNQIGMLFLLQDMDEKAYEYFYRSYEVDSIRRDTIDVVYSLIDLSITYENRNLDTCLQLLRKAKELNDKGNCNISHEVDARLSVIFCEHGQYDSAYVYLQEVLKNVGKIDRSAVYANARNVYMGKGMLDSAKYYGLKLMEMGSVYAKKNSSRDLAQIAFQLGNPALGLKYIHVYDSLADSVERIKAKEALVNANSLYNYEVREKENTHLKMERKIYIIIFLSIAIISCLIISILIIYNIKRRKEQQRQSLSFLMLKKMEEENRLHSEQEIRTREKEIEGITQKIQETDEDNGNLRLQLEEQKEKLRIIVEDKKGNMLKHDIQKQRLTNSSAFSMAQSNVKAKQPLSVSQWDVMEKELDGILGDFKYFINKKNNISKLEYHICLLVKMGFTNADISTLVSRQPNSISQSRRRLYKKLTGRDGKAIDLDEFVKAL